MWKSNLYAFTYSMIVPTQHEDLSVDPGTMAMACAATDADTDKINDMISRANAAPTLLAALRAIAGIELSEDSDYRHLCEVMQAIARMAEPR